MKKSRLKLFMRILLVQSFIPFAIVILEGKGMSSDLRAAFICMGFIGVFSYASINCIAEELGGGKN